MKTPQNNFKKASPNSSLPPSEAFFTLSIAYLVDFLQLLELVTFETMPGGDVLVLLSFLLG